MREQVLGTTAPVLSIWLDPGEGVVAEVGDFAWMTDSIEMAPSDRARQEASDPYSCAVLSGPGPVWLQSIPVNSRD